MTEDEGKHSKEREFRSPELIWAPVISEASAQEYGFADLSDYWRQTEAIIRRELYPPGKATLRLYLEGVATQTLNTHSLAFNPRPYFDKCYPEYERLKDSVDETVTAQKSKAPGVFNQWNVILSLLKGEGNIMIEVCGMEPGRNEPEDFTKRINQNLKPGEIGVLILGKEDPFILEGLSPNIKVKSTLETKVEAPLTPVTSGVSDTKEKVLQRV